MEHTNILQSPWLGSAGVWKTLQRKQHVGLGIEGEAGGAPRSEQVFLELCSELPCAAVSGLSPF